MATFSETGFNSYATRQKIREAILEEEGEKPLVKAPVAIAVVRNTEGKFLVRKYDENHKHAPGQYDLVTCELDPAPGHPDEAIVNEVPHPRTYESVIRAKLRTIGVAVKDNSRVFIGMDRRLGEYDVKDSEGAIVGKQLRDTRRAIEGYEVDEEHTTLPANEGYEWLSLAELDELEEQHREQIPTPKKSLLRRPVLRKAMEFYDSLIKDPSLADQYLDESGYEKVENFDEDRSPWELERFQISILEIAKRK